MSQAQAVTLKAEVESAAIKAVYQLQYNTAKAASYIVGELPAASEVMAREAIAKVVRVQKVRK
jgi:hypothetical protein